MNKIVILMMVIVLAGCTVSTPEPTPTATLTLVPTETPEPTATLTSTPAPTSTVDLDKAKIKANFVKTLSEGYETLGSPYFKCDSVSWVDDEFKVVWHLTDVLSRDLVLHMQYDLITQYAEIFADTLREVASPDLVVKIIFTMGQYDKQIMSTTLFSTLEKINNGRITEAVEWAQEAEIVEP